MKKIVQLAAVLAFATVLACAGLARADCDASGPDYNRRVDVQSILDDVALSHALDPALLSAIARAESNECIDAVSAKGAAGLMQLMPQTALEFGVEDRFDPVQNALGAARFIDYLRRERPSGKLALPEILAAYNAGEAAVERAGGIPHYRETEEYVRRVLWLYLLGHVPASQRGSGVTPHAGAPAKAAAMHPASRQAIDGDLAILDELAALRRSRDAVETPAPR